MKRFKINLLLAAVAASFVGVANAADEHKGHDHAGTGAHAGHDAKPQQGGIVTVVKDVNYELVAKADVVALYVTDHGKPVDLKGATAKLTLLSASDKTEVSLAPVEGRLEAKGTYKLAAGTKAMASISLPGKSPVSVRFTLP